LTSLQELGRALVALGIIAVLTGTAATAQNLDQGKSAAKLFADGCAACHRSPRGLAKGRFKLTLYLFLKEHYASGPDSASALASYLESVDSSQRGPSRAAARPLRSATGTPHPSMRPPKPVPGR
jgi:mono/diheme cytochrome c family protein